MKTNTTNSYKKRLVRTPRSDVKHLGIFKSQDYYGFIEDEDLYVKWENINTALNKDLVEYVILEYEDQFGERREEAKIVNVVQRAKVLFIGELIHKEPDYELVLLDNQKLSKVVTVAPSKFPIGEKLQVKLTDFHLDNLQGNIIKSLGHKTEQGIEIKSILEDFGVAWQFSPEVEKIAEQIELDIEGKSKDPNRKDYTHIPFVTIDPTDSKDFDDAICVLKSGDNYHLYVAIADVWSYVKDHPELIKEAEKRSTSIYFLNSVVPMLPDKLCNNYCSLVPNEKRCSIVMDIKIKPDGTVLWDEFNIAPGIINSRRRFSYGEVNDFFEGNSKLENDSKEVIDTLLISRELYKLLEQKRVEKGYVAIEIPETKIKMDSNGMIIDCYKYIRKEAQFMIENFMILANELVATFMAEQNIPALFRVHPRPEPSKIATFIGEVTKLDFKVREGDENITQKIIFRWFNENKNHPLLESISILFLRSSQKALYSITNTGHFGLNLEHYLHFTSPIRRYPDTIVHSMLWKYVFEKQDKPKGNRDPIYVHLDDIAKHCNEKEIVASEISRTIENIKVMKWLNTKLEKIFKAQVVSPAKFGGFVKLQELNVEGFVKCKEILKLGDWLLVRPIHNSKEFKVIRILPD